MSLKFNVFHRTGDLELIGDRMHGIILMKIDVKGNPSIHSM